MHKVHFQAWVVFSYFLQTWTSIVHIYVLPVPLNQGCQNSAVPLALVYIRIAQSLFDTVTPWVDINANMQKEFQSPASGTCVYSTSSLTLHRHRSPPSLPTSG